ncbi:MAG: hypothetical protein HY879_28040 [Deltaproteobacteria bacterium]|nr:hypothetical protein [Deltaproteobacteria bacterium]
MMKKSGILALVVVLLVALAMTAQAFTVEGAKGEKMYIGGLFLTDFGYWNRDKNLTGVDDQTQFITAVPNHSRVRGSLEVGKVGGYWELGNGGEVMATNGVGAGVTNYIETRKLYGWYRFGNCEILAGKNDGYVYTLSPYQNIGLNNGAHVGGFGWGSIYDSRNPQVRFTQNVSKAFGYAITLLQPNVYVDQTRTSYATLPAVAAKLMMNFGVISLFPAGLYQQVKWDKMPGGFDDTMTSWLAVLPVKVTAGGFVGVVQAGYGQNLSGVLALQSSFHSYLRDSTGKVKNTTGLNGFVDLSYNIGSVTPHIYFGYDKASNSDVWKTGDDNVTRTMVGIGISCKVADSFYVVPEFTMYDYGKKPNDAAKPDFGKEWLGGVQFQFVF